MYEIIIALAEVLGGQYELLNSGAVRAEGLLGMLAGCGAIDPAYAGDCVNAALGAK